jgi:hypothetical protein
MFPGLHETKSLADVRSIENSKWSNGLDFSLHEKFHALLHHTELRINQSAGTELCKTGNLPLELANVLVYDLLCIDPYERPVSCKDIHVQLAMSQQVTLP